jgi:serine/threonine-protein kinase
MALLFFRSPEEPVRCALEISKALQEHPHIQVRMGVHSGPVNQVTDVNDKTNIAGPGINVAQRVMDCGDAGHILLSGHLAEDLAQYRHWQPYLHDLGECEVKHGLCLHLFNLYKDNLGNPHLPDKLKRRRRWKQTSGVSVRPVITPRWPNYVLTAVLLVSAVALAISFSVFYRRGSPAVARSSSGKAAAVGLAIAEKSIAVLPFENLSEERANAYFADGVQDEILTYLAKIAALKVISRTSVMQYKSGVARNLREIAQQLGVANVVEGSVQRSGNRVRVNAQLVDARTDAHLWAQTYDRDLADVFAIQSEIAKAIAEQLQAKLSPNEKKAIEQSPTTDLAAFDLYSRAKSLLLTASFSVTQDQDRRKAIELLDEAVKRDPSFFDAYCQLAGAHEDLYAVSGSDHTPTRLALAEAALQAATRLRPDAAETHLARAQYLYYGLRDYAGALAELEIARRALPNDPRLFELTGYILRLRGQQEEGLQNLERAVELDPRNFNTLQQISLSYQYLGRYAEAIAAIDRAVAIVPDNVETRANRAEYELFWKADTRPLRQTIDAILAQGPGAIARAASSWFDCALAERDPAAAERALVALGDNPCWGESATNLSRSFGEGLLARMTKDETRARTAFEAARAQQEKIVQGQPDYGPTLCVLGLIDAALGRKDLALDEGRRAIALMPVEKDVKNGSLVLQYFAITAAWAGEKELALQQLEAGLRAPTASLMLSYGALKLLPFWDPLRGDPRFEKIVTSLAPKKP